MSYTIHWEDKGVNIVTTGVFGDDFLKASVAATKDPRFVDAEYAIVDFLNVEDFPVHSATMWKIALSDSAAYKLNPNLKLAVLTNKMVMVSLTHMYKVYVELNNKGNVWDIEIFTNHRQAREWVSALQGNDWLKAQLPNKEFDHKANRSH